jgi:hypothetical protein
MPSWALAQAQIPALTLPADVELSRRGNILILINHSQQPQLVTLPGRAPIALPAVDVAVI